MIFTNNPEKIGYQDGCRCFYSEKPVNFFNRTNLLPSNQQAKYQEGFTKAVINCKSGLQGFVKTIQDCEVLYE